MAAFRALLAEGPLLLSGGLGSELERRGAPMDPPLWSTAAQRARPDLVRRVHAEYARAGARVLVVNTFRTDRYTLAKVGLAAEARALTRQAVDLARQGLARSGVRHPVLIAGSISPLEDCYRPDLVPPVEVLRREHALRAGDLLAAGLTFAFVETQNTLHETVQVLEAAKAGGLDVAISFVLDPHLPRLLSGESLEDAVRATSPFEPQALMVNCSPLAVTTEAVRRLRDLTPLPVGAYAQAPAAPGKRPGWPGRQRREDRAYVAEALGWVRAGAQVVGGCCGTRPSTIRRLARELAPIQPAT